MERVSSMYQAEWIFEPGLYAHIRADKYPGVGAVKIQPGVLEDDEEAMSGSDSESAASAESDGSKDSTDAEVEVEWDPTADDDEEEPINPNRCIFCQQDEENDPSEEFELYLACGVCGDNGMFNLIMSQTRLTRL
jgi:hypothetical protein